MKRSCNNCYYSPGAVCPACEDCHYPEYKNWLERAVPDSKPTCMIVDDILEKRKPYFEVVLKDGRVESFEGLASNYDIQDGCIMLASTRLGYRVVLMVVPIENVEFLRVVGGIETIKNEIKAIEDDAKEGSTE